MKLNEDLHAERLITFL